MSQQKSQPVLIGYLRPSEEQPGFVLPVFRVRDSNRRVAQVIGEDGIITGFREIPTPAMHELEAPDREVALGEPALWGYALDSADVRIEYREDLADWLRDRIATVSNPLLRLQVAEFCDRERDVDEAWRASFETLQKSAPRSADAWRDFVILPTEVRNAIRHTVQRNALDVGLGDLGRDVAVAVHGQVLHVAIEPGLYAALTAHPTAMSDLTARTALVRNAFDLGPELITGPRAQGAPTESKLAHVRDPIVVAVGSSTIQTVRQTPLFASHQHNRVDGDVLRFPSTFLPYVAIREDAWRQGEVTDAESLDSLLPDFRHDQTEVIFFVFPAISPHDPAFQLSCKFAELASKSGHIAIGLIPHLPHAALTRDALEYRLLQDMLRASFNSIFLVSDRSAHNREPLAFSPVRNPKAAGRRIAELVSRVKHEPDASFLVDSATVPDGPLRVQVLTSASADRMRPVRLFEQAFARAKDFTLDFSTSSDIDTRTTSGAHGPWGVEFPALLAVENLREARVTNRGGISFDGGPREISVQFSGVSWWPLGLDNFEDYCRRELERFGWRVRAIKAQDADLMIEDGEHTSKVSCKAFSMAAGGRPLRSSPARRSPDDTILLTNALVHRSDFYRHMLNGYLLVNASRLEALRTIYARRYAYVVRRLQSGSTITDKALASAAFGYVTLVHRNGPAPGSSERAWTYQLVSQQVSRFRDAARIELTLEGRPARTKDTPVLIEANLVLHSGGWEIDLVRDISSDDSDSAS